MNDEEKDKEYDIYDSTVDRSMEMSILKALEIQRTIQQNTQTSVIRPDFNPKKGLFKMAVVVVMMCIMFVLLKQFNLSVSYGLVVIVVVVVLNAKKAILWMILLYQKYAPEKVRASCVFTPSCSQYMILAIDKYGVVRGVFKGILRLLRCHPPNGGVDYP